MKIVLPIITPFIFLFAVSIISMDLHSHERVRWKSGETEDRKELPTMTFKQIKPFVLLGKVTECVRYSRCYNYETIFLCNGEKFTFTNWRELRKYNEFLKIVDRERTAIKQRQNQAEFLKHLQKTVNAEYDKIAEERTKK